MRALIAFDRVLGAALMCGAVLVLPVSLLLFLQWPLRELLHSYSREANDFAQLLFALYVSIAVTCATINVVGGFIITDRMLGMFKHADRAKGEGK